MKRISMATLAFLAAAPMAQAQANSAESVAAAVLTGFVQQDATLIAPHSNGNNADFFAGIVAGTEEASELFGGTRGAAGAAWDGMILPARYDELRAYIPFAIEGDAGPANLGSGAAGRFVVITLELDSPDDAHWGLEDINFLTRERFNGFAQTRP